MKKIRRGDMSLIRLKEWEEIVGRFEGLEKDEFTLLVQFEEFHFILNSASHEAEIIEKLLSSNLIGRKIGLLRTDLIEKPFIAREIVKGG
jgi:hypothetical protein